METKKKKRLEDMSREELIGIVKGCSKSIKHLKRNRKWRLKWMKYEYEVVREANRYMAVNEERLKMEVLGLKTQQKP